MRNLLCLSKGIDLAPLLLIIYQTLYISIVVITDNIYSLFHYNTYRLWVLIIDYFCSWLLFMNLQTLGNELKDTETYTRKSEDNE